MSIDEPRGSQTMTLNDVGEERREAIRECPADGGDIWDVYMGEWHSRMFNTGTQGSTRAQHTRKRRPRPTLGHSTQPAGSRPERTALVSIATCHHFPRGNVQSRVELGRLARPSPRPTRSRSNIATQNWRSRVSRTRHLIMGARLVGLTLYYMYYPSAS